MKTISPFVPPKPSHPFFKMWQDLTDTFKPYVSRYWQWFEFLQPLRGFANLLRGGLYLVATPVVAMLQLFHVIYRYAAEDAISVTEEGGHENAKHNTALHDNMPPGLTKKRYAFLAVLTQSTNWFSAGLGYIVRGGLQILTSPMTWLRILPRIAITRTYGRPKVENLSPVRRAFSEANFLYNALHRKGLAHATAPEHVGLKQAVKHLHHAYQKHHQHGEQSGQKFEQRIYARLSHSKKGPFQNTAELIAIGGYLKRFKPPKRILSNIHSAIAKAPGAKHTRIIDNHAAAGGVPQSNEVVRRNAPAAVPRLNPNPSSQLTQGVISFFKSAHHHFLTFGAQSPAKIAALEVINSARENLRIVTDALSSQATSKALSRAIRRGVTVEIIMPKYRNAKEAAKSDSLSPNILSIMNLTNTLLRQGDKAGKPYAHLLNVNWMEPLPTASGQLAPSEARQPNFMIADDSAVLAGHSGLSRERFNHLETKDSVSTLPADIVHYSQQFNTLCPKAVMNMQGPIVQRMPQRSF